MSFAGDLRTMDVFDLLAWISGRRKAGTMSLARRSTRKTLAFRDGRLQWSGSNDPRETLGQVLVRDGLISEEALFRALLRQEQEKIRLGQILLAGGLLSESQLLHALRANAEAQLHELFLWPDGRFELDDLVTPPEGPADLQIQLEPVLEEGRHRRQMWQQLRQRFPSGDVVFRVGTDGLTNPDPIARRIVELAAAGRTLAAISLEIRRSEYETALLVAGLCDEGLLVVDRTEDPSADSDPVGAITALLALAELRLAEQSFGAAFESYEKVLALDHLNQDAKKGLLALADARRKAKAVRKVPLDRIPVLRLTGTALATQRFSPEEGFVLSRVNGEWDIRSILKLCPMPEEDALLICSQLLERQVIALR